MIFSRPALANSLFHQSREGWCRVDGRIDSFSMQSSIDVDLALSDVASEVWDRMCNVVSGHGENRHLGDRALTTMKSSRPLVDRREVGVHVTWISSSSRDLFSSCRDLSESFCIVRHVSKNDQDVGSEFDGEILSGRQCESRGQDSFDGGVVCEVDEHGYVVEGSLFLEVVSEEASFISGDAHGREDCCEWFFGASDLGLPGNLGGDLVVWQSGRGEEGEFLSPDERVHAVDGGDACLDELSRIFSGERVDGTAVYIEIIIRNNSWAAVCGSAAAVEDPTEHVL